MQLSIEYTAQLRRAAGVASETIDLPAGCTLEQLARALADRHGEELRRVLLNGDGRLQRSVLIFVGDEQVSPDCNVPLLNGQTVTFAAPISGG
jgi:molybdopterin converting factor small subunit